MKTTGEGKPSITVPLLVFSDEISGNTTKKWNCLENFSIENMHFLSTSNVVPSVPLGKSIASDLQGT
jgi:hypothetical protein